MGAAHLQGVDGFVLILVAQRRSLELTELGGEDGIEQTTGQHRTDAQFHKGARVGQDGLQCWDEAERFHFVAGYGPTVDVGVQLPTSISWHRMPK